MKLPAHKSFIDITNKIFGRLIVIRYIGRDNQKIHCWECRCDCGNHIITRGTSLRSYHVKSCGCLSIETAKNKMTIHGSWRTPTYGSWDCMIQRCTNKNHKNFRYYGGRGITICERWRNSFENFLADMGERPKGKTLDRWPDNNGNYEPGNCRWATPKEQAANKSRKK